MGYRGMIEAGPMSFSQDFPHVHGLWSRCPITWECSGSWSRKSDDDIISVGFMVGSITITFFSRLEVIAWQVLILTAVTPSFRKRWVRQAVAGLEWIQVRADLVSRVRIWHKELTYIHIG